MAGVVAASLVLIAPGTAIAGVPVGGLTAGAAADAVASQLAQTKIVLSGEGGGVVLTGADLDAHVDAEGLADAAYQSSPMWNPRAWFAGSSKAHITVDEKTVSEVLRRAVPSAFRDGVDAKVAYDPAAHAYTVTPATDGTGIPAATVTEALRTAFAEGRSTTTLDVSTVPMPARTTTAAAQKTADALNEMIATAGFYVGTERTVPIDADTLASWLTLSTDAQGAFQITADAPAIQAMLDTLAPRVDRAAVDEKEIVAKAGGKVYKTESAGHSGRTLQSVAGLGEELARTLAARDATLELPVTEVAPKLIEVVRSIEIDLSAMKVFLLENGKRVDWFWMSAGKPSTPTYTGTYRVIWKQRIQDMGCVPGYDYCTKNVPWIMYFNGDQALHGAYWHNGFGRINPSHGCVNLPVSVAKHLYEWTPMQAQVVVHR